MSLTILESGPPLTSTELLEVENRINRKIPTDYRTFLLEHNGGYPDPSDFSMQSKVGSTGTIEYFLGINVADHFNIERYLRVFGERIPLDLFPIASDPGGNLICAGVSGSRENKIYFWDHEFEEVEGEEEINNNLYLIADTLTELLEKLR